MKIALSIVLFFFGLTFGLPEVTAQTFTRGQYTDLEDQQHKGQVAYKIGQNFFEFREDRQQKGERFRPRDVRSFVWGIDSFVVRQENFVRVLIPEGRVRLYRDDRTGKTRGRNPIVGDKRPGFSYIVRTFILERSETGELLVLENKKKKKFVAQVSEFFADAPGLIAQVEEGKFGPADVRQLVKTYNNEYAEDPGERKN